MERLNRRTEVLSDEMDCSPSVDTCISSPGGCSTGSMAAKVPFLPPVQFVKDRRLDSHLPGEPLLKLNFVGSKCCSDPDWEDWRNSLKCTVGGHTLAGLLGYGYEGSSDKYFKRLVGLEKRPEPGWFAKKAMQHGKETEGKAKTLMKRLYSEGTDPEPVIEYFEEESLVYDIHLASDPLKKIRVCVTPDMIFERRHARLSNFSHRRVTEIKCPFYMSEKHIDPNAFAHEWVKGKILKHGRGFDPAYWIQAMFYGWILNMHDVDIAMAFYCTQSDYMCIMTRGFSGFNDAFDANAPISREPALAAVLFTEFFVHLIEYIHSGDYNKKYYPFGLTKKQDVHQRVIDCIDSSCHRKESQLVYLDKPVYHWHANNTFSVPLS